MALKKECRLKMAVLFLQEDEEREEKLYLPN